MVFGVKDIARITVSIYAIDIWKDTIAPNIMLNGFQKAACRSAATITAMPQKITIQKGYDWGSERSLGLFGALKTVLLSSLRIDEFPFTLRLLFSVKLISPVFHPLHLLGADSKTNDH